MTWSNTNSKKEKIKFIGDWLKEEFNLSDLCKRYGISRKTGYKWIDRYETEGECGLGDKPHTRHHHPNQTPPVIQLRLIELKHRYPKWGPDKLRDWLLINEPQGAWPAVSTIGDILKRNGLVKARKYRRHVPANSLPFSDCDRANRVWSADFKGQFRLGSGVYCYPLTVSDNYSRFLLGCEGLLSPNLEASQRVLKRLFNEYGLPDAIRTDNGQPFAGLGVGGLTRLSVWWLKLGIVPERIQPGCPEQNGRHERMHRTLKEATVVPAGSHFKQQQDRFDHFRQEYNYERPHQGLDGKRPGDIYEKSQRLWTGKESEVVYPHSFEVRKVRSNGEIKWFGKKYYLSELLQGEPIGLEIIDDGRAIVHFAKLKLGLMDARQDKIVRL